MEMIEQRPFRVLLLGDFSGRAWRADNPDRAKPVAIDVDNIDAVLRWHALALDLSGIRLRFDNLDDFHPDRLCENPDLFLDLAVDIVAAPDPAPPPPPENVLEQIVQETETARSIRAADRLSDFVERITAPHLEPLESAEDRQRRESREEAESRRLRQILHHPAFQSLEAAWRGVDFLLRAAASAPEVQFFLLDVSRDEIFDGVDSIVRRVRRPYDDPWGALVLLTAFRDSERDLAPLGRWAEMGLSERAPVLAEADPGLVNAGEAWGELRSRPVSRHLGLAAPRFLLRLPYGAETSPLDSRAFEEMPDPPDPAAYLWGCPAIACAAMMAEAFARDGWDLRLGGNAWVEGLPVHVFRHDGEPYMQPSVERLLDDEEMERWLDAGIMPLLGSRTSDRLMLVRWQSIANPAMPLAAGRRP